MAAPGFTIFATAIGACGIAWGAAGITGVWLPEPSLSRLRARIARRQPGAESAPPEAVASVVTALSALLAGEAADLSQAPLDLSSIEPFAQRVYALARTIAPGRVLTYGEIAARLGTGASARSVGQALGANPFPLIVPCHRVVAANDRLGGFSAPGGTALKRRLLAIEGARRGDEPDLFDPPGRAGAVAAGSRAQVASGGVAAAAGSSAPAVIEVSGRS